tara:strand:+ start:4356 stop:4601 length:246 start_codon:yes stop_codon:yes gene_type:complete
LINDWTSFLPQEDKARRKQDVHLHSLAWPLMMDVVKDRLSKLEVKEPDYAKASWAYEQAHDNGKNQAYRDILNLLTSVTKE